MRIGLIKNKIFVLFIPFLLAACSVFSPVKMEQTNTYVINTLPRLATKKPAHRITLMVMQPEAIQIYNTTRMAYSTQPYQVAYFSKSSWAVTPAQMLQSLLAQTLQNTHYFYAVSSASSIGYYDYVLNMQLLQFEQRFFAHSSDVIITLRVQLIKSASNQVVAAKQFTVIEAAPENTPYGGVVAANRATANILAQIARFCVSVQGTKL